MKSRFQVCFFVALAIMVTGAGFLYYFKTHQKLGVPGVKVGDVPILDDNGKVLAPKSVLLPENVAGFKSRALPILSKELNMLPKDTTYGRRFYQSEDGVGATVNVVLMGSDRTSIHKPEFCLPSQGLQIEKRELIAIRTKDPSCGQFPAMKWTIKGASRDQNGNITQFSGLYIFWFVSQNDITAEHRTRVLSMAKHLLTKGELQRWAYVAYYSFCAPGQETVMANRLEQLISESVPEFQIAQASSHQQ